MKDECIINAIVKYDAIPCVLQRGYGKRLAQEWLASFGEPKVSIRDILLREKGTGPERRVGPTHLHIFSGTFACVELNAFLCILTPK
jgi:hypothetical protein